MSTNLKMRPFMTLVIVVTFLFLAIRVSPAQTDEIGRWKNGVSEPWWFDPEPMTTNEIAIAQSRWQSIELENGKSVADDWVGDYFVGGETHGSFMRWSPENGFVLMHVDKCRATVMNLDYGKVIVTDSSVQLIPELNKTTAGHGNAHSGSKPLTFLKVRWRGNRLLVGENKIADFGDFVAGLGKFNNSYSDFYEYVDFFISTNSREDESKAQFLPVLPLRYERFLKSPIDATITKIGMRFVKHDPENEWWDKLIQRLTVNVGREHGLKRGMNLLLIGSERAEKIEITHIGLQSATGIIVRETRKRPCVKIEKDDDCKDPEYDPITVGMKASTSPFRE